MSLNATLLLLATATTAAAPSADVPPEQAAGTALMQCVAHTLGKSLIVSSNAEAMSAVGLIYSDNPPSFLSSTRVTAYGVAHYAHAISTAGEVWAVGYDKGTCLVFTLGTSVAPVEKRITELFNIPNAWKPEKPAEAAPGERKLRFGWNLRPNKVSALISLRDLPGPAIGMTMVTIAMTTGNND